MWRHFSQTRDTYCLHCSFYTLSNMCNWETTYRQSPGNVIFNNRGDDLIIRVLEDHTYAIANSTLLCHILRIKATHYHSPAVRDEQGVTMPGQRRFTTTVMSQQDDILPLLYLKTHILQSRIYLS